MKTYVVTLIRTVSVVLMRGDKICFMEKNGKLSLNICCDPSIEPSRRDGSNEGSQDLFIVKENQTQLRKFENYL